MKLDFTGVQDLEFTVIPAGTYRAECFSVKPKKAQNSGNPMLEWSFNIVSGEYEGRRVFTNTVLLPQTMWKLKAMLRGFDLGGQELTEEVEFEPEDLIGQQVYIKITQRPDQNGQMRNDINGTISVEEGEAKESAEEDLPF